MGSFFINHTLTLVSIIFKVMNNIWCILEFIWHSFRKTFFTFLRIFFPFIYEFLGIRQIELFKKVIYKYMKHKTINNTFVVHNVLSCFIYITVGDVDWGQGWLLACSCTMPSVCAHCKNTWIDTTQHTGFLLVSFCLFIKQL